MVHCQINWCIAFSLLNCTASVFSRRFNIYVYILQSNVLRSTWHASCCVVYLGSLFEYVFKYHFIRRWVHCLHLIPAVNARATQPQYTAARQIATQFPCSLWASVQPGTADVRSAGAGIKCLYCKFNVPRPLPPETERLITLLSLQIVVWYDAIFVNNLGIIYSFSKNWRRVVGLVLMDISPSNIFKNSVSCMSYHEQSNTVMPWIFGCYLFRKCVGYPSH